MDLITKINDLYPKMSKGQKRIANYIAKDFDKAVFMTAAKLGREVNVSESTVVRFASLLGYNGYPDFQKALEQYVFDKLSDVTRQNIKLPKDNNNILTTTLESDENNIKQTLSTIDKASFELALNIIDSSKKIYICGIRSCFPLAEALGFYLNMLYDNVIVLRTNSPSELFEQMLHINKSDCFIGISFPRYSMRTLKAMEFANDKNARIISITDSVHSPMCLYSACNITAASSMTSIVDSLVAPLSVINAIVVALCEKNPKKSHSTFESLEEIWEDYQIYEKDEINLINDNK